MMNSIQSEKIEISEFVPIENLRKLREKIVILNKKAKKNSLPEIVLSYGERTTKTIKYYDDSFQVEMVRCILVGEYPRLLGYEFLAKLEKHGDRNLIIGSKSNFDVSWETKPGFCDHCKSKRDRKETYVIKKTDSEDILQIGSSCIDTFIGSSSLSSVAARATLFSIFADTDLFERSQTDKTSTPVSTFDFLSAVIAHTKKYGYVTAAASESSDNKKSTAYSAYLMLNPPKGADSGDVKITSADRELSEKAILEIDKIILTVNNPSLRANIKTLYACPDLEVERINTAALLGKLFLESQDMSTAPAASVKKEKCAGNFLGAIGEKREFKVEVGSKRNFESRFNNNGTNMIIMMDEEQNTILTMTGGNFNPEIGSRLKIRATIKAHKEYQDVKQTIIQRASILECEEIENLKKQLSRMTFLMILLTPEGSIEKGHYEGDIRKDIEKVCEKFGMLSNSCDLYTSYSNEDEAERKTIPFNLGVRSKSSHNENILFQLTMVRSVDRISYSAKIAE
jgi:hypothetical protein